MSGDIRRLFLVAASIACTLWSGAASAQSGSSIAGAVRDATGGVLPGVSIEASSPALIEKTRTVVTDSQGLYKVIDLRPGTYVVTFTLPGFATVRREGIELTASFTATVNAEMRVGGLEETITVSGQAPTVDIQNVVQQRIMTRDVIDAIPTGNRSFANLATFIPGSTTSNDVGGTVGRAPTVTIHNTRATETQLLIDGMTYNHGGGVGGAQSGLNSNDGAVQEISLEIGGLGAESELAGVRTNIIPKEGSNTFKGALTVAFTNGDLQSNNLDDALRAQGLTASDSVSRIWDVNPGFGGPFVEDRLWFYVSGRSWGTKLISGTNYFNKTPNALFYTPDPDRPAHNDRTLGAYSARLTYQPSQKNKIAAYWTLERSINPNYTNIATNDPAVTLESDWAPNYVAQLSWTNPVTSRVLLQAGVTYVNFAYPTTLKEGLTLDKPSYRESAGFGGIPAGYIWGNYQQPSTTAIGSQAEFIGPGDNSSHQYNLNFSASYVTGSHAAKVGVRFIRSDVRNAREHVTGNEVTLQLLRGVPNQVTQWATPFDFQEQLNGNLGIFAQDQWTVKRLTLNGGLRFDWVNASVPAISLPAGRFVPARTFPEVENVPNWKDFSPRLGASYDLFGDGKTAVKASLGRFIEGVSLITFTRLANPQTAAVAFANRAWTDSNGDFLPQENELGPLSDIGFGGTRVRTRYDTDAINGWGKRGYNWEVTGAVQREVFAGTSVNVGYFRRWYGNARVTDNLAVGPSDFDPFCVTAPVDARLPNGGGHQVCGLYDVTPAKFGLVENVITLASKFGDQREVHDSVDVSVNARLARGIIVSAGTATGRTLVEGCYTIDSPQNLLNCRVAPPFQTQIKGYVVYPLPWQLTTSAGFRVEPGPQITAGYTATNAEVRTSLGRDTASRGSIGGIPLLDPGTEYGERLIQVDYRVARNFRVSGTRLQARVDLFNLFNANPVLGQNNTYGTSWLRPSSILNGRLIKFGAQMDF
jgi:hypothetical protein